MAGYMGFGMQSWVYKKSPRKPFEKRGRVPSFSPLPKYERTFVLKPKVKEKTKLNGFMLLISIIAICTLIGVMSVKFYNHSSKITVAINTRQKLEDKQAFIFLVNSGKNRLQSNNIIGAYSEFSLAYNIKNNSLHLNELIIQTLSILCEKDTNYCNDLDKFLETI